MRALSITTVCFLALLEGLSADAPASVELTGIVDVDGRKSALLEITTTRGRVERPILSEGESTGGVQVRRLDSKSGRAQLVVDGHETTYLIKGAADDKTARALHLQGADLSQILEIYQQLCGRTVLFPTTLPASKFDLKTAALTRAEAVAALEAVLRGHGLELQQRGTKFVFVVKADQIPRLGFIPDTSRLPDLSSEVLPAGLMKFMSAEVLQVLEIYQELSGRTVLQALKHGDKISVRTQTPLTRAEAVWVLDAVLALADVAMLPEGEKFVFALKGIENPEVPFIEVPTSGKQLSPEPLFPPLRFSSTPLTNVLAVYAKLLGREPLPLGTTPALRMSLRAQSALTPAETLFALDALAALHRCKFVLVGENQVKVIPAALAGSNP